MEHSPSQVLLDLGSLGPLGAAAGPQDRWGRTWQEIEMHTSGHQSPKNYSTGRESFPRGMRVGGDTGHRVTEIQGGRQIPVSNVHSQRVTEGSPWLGWESPVSY